MKAIGISFGVVFFTDVRTVFLLDPGFPYSGSWTEAASSASFYSLIASSSSIGTTSIPSNFIVSPFYLS